MERQRTGLMTLIRLIKAGRSCFLMTVSENGRDPPYVYCDCLLTTKNCLIVVNSGHKYLKCKIKKNKEIKKIKLLYHAQILWQPNSVWSPFQKELISFGAIFKVLSICHRPQEKPRMAACFVVRSDLKCFDTLFPISHTSVK